MVQPDLMAGVTERLREFVAPFVRSLFQGKQRVRATNFIGGLLSDVERKNAESIAYRYDEERKDMQYFLGESEWDHRPLLVELATQVGRDLGRADGVIVFDPSGFAKKGTESVGVQRQWCGRLGKVDNCQVGIFLGYVSEVEHALVNERLFLPADWARDQARREKCHVPDDVCFATRHRLCLDMLDEVGELLPHGWIAGDDEMGRSTAFRRELRERRERNLLAVPSNTLIRDLDVIPADDPWRSPVGKDKFQRVEKWRAALDEAAWQRIDVRDGEKGPLIVDLVSWRVQAKTSGGRVGPEELLVVIRSRETGSDWKHDYYLSNASAETAPAELARVAKAEHRIEDCFQRAKSDAGLAHYEVRGWGGWHHHMALSMVAAWFLNVETRRGEKKDGRPDAFAGPLLDRSRTSCRARVRSTGPRRQRLHATTRTKSDGSLLPLQTSEPLMPSSFRTQTFLEQ